MPLKIYRRGEVWHYRGTVAGRRLRGSCGTSVKEEAERIAAKRQSEAWERHRDGPKAVLTFAQAAILYRAEGKSTRFLEQVEDYWKDTLVRDMTGGAIRQAAVVLYPKASGATRNRAVIIPTQAVINHAARFDKCAKISVDRFPVEKTEKTPATWAWVQAFMKVAPPHLGALACFMFLTGARISEALAVRWEDVDFDAGRALIKSTKTKTERRAHLPAPLIIAIANCKRDRPNVFRYVSRGSASKSWDDVVERNKLPKLSPHSCRHGFATGLLHAGLDPVTVAKRGGWKNVQHVLTTYGHAMEDETVTDALTGTKSTQRKTGSAVND